MNLEIELDSTPTLKSVLMEWELGKEHLVWEWELVEILI